MNLVSRDDYINPDDMVSKIACDMKNPDTGDHKTTYNPLFLSLITNIMIYILI